MHLRPSCTSIFSIPALTHNITGPRTNSALAKLPRTLFRLHDTFHRPHIPNLSPASLISCAGKKPIAMLCTIDDILTVGELYQDRVLAPPKQNECDLKACQEMNKKVGIIKANIANLELDAIVNVLAEPCPVR